MHKVKAWRWAKEHSIYWKDRQWKDGEPPEGVHPSRIEVSYAAEEKPEDLIEPIKKPLTEAEMYAIEEKARIAFKLHCSGGPRGQQITYWDSLIPWIIREVENHHGIKST